MRFEHVNTYSAPPAEVHAMLVDSAFREKVCRLVRSVDSTVTVATSGDVVTVEVSQTQRVRKVPAFAAKLVGDTVEIRQVERWAAPTTADLELTIPGKPGHLHGVISLVASPRGTTQTISGDLKVGIPLVGGKLEGVIAGVLRMFLEAEQKAGQAWLADKH